MNILASKEYSNWKDATVAFKAHENSAYHHEAVYMIITLPATTMHIGTQLSRQYALEMAMHRRMLLKKFFWLVRAYLFVGMI